MHDNSAMDLNKDSYEARVRVLDVRTLSDDWYVLKKTRFALLRRDGVWQEMTRETYDRGNGATVLLYNRERRKVVLTRQFRYPAYVNGHSGMLIEAAAGLLEQANPEECIRAEAEEETGFRIGEVKRVFEAFMSPGSVTERLYFFVAPYEAGSQAHKGGGNAEEGEDIEVLEPSFDDAWKAIQDGVIQDGKTILLLQYAALHLFAEAQTT